MNTIYEFHIKNIIPFQLEMLLDMLNRLTENHEIEMITKSTDKKSYISASFGFLNWKTKIQQMSKKENLSNQRKKNDKTGLGNLQNNVKQQIQEAMNSESVASTIVFSVEATENEIIFQSKELKLKNSNQIIQVGIYLQCKLKSFFHKLQSSDDFLSLKIIES